MKKIESFIPRLVKPKESCQILLDSGELAVVEIDGTYRQGRISFDGDDIQKIWSQSIDGKQLLKIVFCDPKRPDYVIGELGDDFSEDTNWVLMLNWRYASNGRRHKTELVAA